MTKFARSTIDLFHGSSLDDQPCYYPVGGMEVATTDERYKDLSERSASQNPGTEGTFISADETCQEHTFAQRSKIKGAYFVPNDNSQNRLGERSDGEGSPSQGSSISGAETKVTGIGISGGRVKEVIIESGAISTDNILICTGIWGPKVAKMARITLPLSPMEHLTPDFST